MIARRLRRRILPAAVFVLFAGTAWAQSAPPIEVSGSTYAELDDTSGVWTLRGDPVSVRRGAVTIQAGTIAYDARAQVVRATGGVTYADAVLSASALRITAWLQDERVLAEGGATVRAPEGTLLAERIEAFGDREEIVAEGNGRLVYQDIEGRAPRIVLQRRAASATLSGGAILRQGPHEARAQTISIDLQRRRMTARGGANITVVPDR